MYGSVKICNALVVSVNIFVSALVNICSGFVYSKILTYESKNSMVSYGFVYLVSFIIGYESKNSMVSFKFPWFRLFCFVYIGYESLTPAFIIRYNRI